jgi:diphthamide biosynthesis methyltransferase
VEALKNGHRMKILAAELLENLINLIGMGEVKKRQCTRMAVEARERAMVSCFKFKVGAAMFTKGDAIISGANAP